MSSFQLLDSDLSRRRPKHFEASSGLQFTAQNDAKNPSPSQLPLTLSWDEIPEWQRDNEYLLSGYRRVQNNWKGCIHSVYAYIHNETVNIHTHLFGGILFIYLLGTFHIHHLHALSTATWTDVAVFAIFLTSACFCLLASSIFHMSTCHSKTVSASCHALDYSGIVVLTVGSSFPTIYYAFHDHVASQIAYILGLASFGLVAAYIVLDPTYAKPSHRGARTSVFIALGGAGIIPVTHCLVMHGYKKMVTDMGFGWLVFAGCLYVTGALLYACRIPERLSPGSFDFFFSSHQIFHVCVVVAALSTYRCILQACYHAHGGALLSTAFVLARRV